MVCVNVNLTVFIVRFSFTFTRFDGIYTKSIMEGVQESEGQLCLGPKLFKTIHDSFSQQTIRKVHQGARVVEDNVATSNNAKDYRLLYRFLIIKASIFVCIRLQCY